MKDNNFWYYINYWSHLAAVIITPPIIGLFLGRFLDDRLGTDWVFTISLVILGIFSGLWSMYKEVMR